MRRSRYLSSIAMRQDGVPGKTVLAPQPLLFSPSAMPQPRSGGSADPLSLAPGEARLFDAGQFAAGPWGARAVNHSRSAAGPAESLGQRSDYVPEPSASQIVSDLTRKWTMRLPAPQAPQKPDRAASGDDQRRAEQAAADALGRPAGKARPSRDRLGLDTRGREDSKDSKDIRDIRDIRDSKDSKDSRDSKGARDTRDTDGIQRQQSTLTPRAEPDPVRAVRPGPDRAQAGPAAHDRQLSGRPAARQSESRRGLGSARATEVGARSPGGVQPPPGWPPAKTPASDSTDSATGPGARAADAPAATNPQSVRSAQSRSDPAAASFRAAPDVTPPSPSAPLQPGPAPIRHDPTPIRPDPNQGSLAAATGALEATSAGPAATPDAHLAPDGASGLAALEAVAQQMRAILEPHWAATAAAGSGTRERARASSALPPSDPTPARDLQAAAPTRRAAPAAEARSLHIGRIEVRVVAPPAPVPADRAPVDAAPSPAAAAPASAAAFARSFGFRGLVQI